eukprot:TRINITY_DN14910_c0_g1_i1.p1 TRINITY_DN14910_c0_g1~~TRINITY_DN14910_c0_g1_i1.p1  ORF type:complete len:119 (-),score=15.77 TRINITY_DN14910_c0_g1_i1:676-1032(-)
MIVQSVLGWKRDLTTEGIESNPGPTWIEIIECLKGISGKIPEDLQNTLLEKLGNKPSFYSYKKRDFTDLKELDENSKYLVELILEKIFVEESASQSDISQIEEENRTLKRKLELKRRN